MNYKLKQKNGEHFVLEKETNVLYGPYKEKETARQRMRFFNMGGAFDGYTPKYMILKNRIIS